MRAEPGSGAVQSGRDSDVKSPPLAPSFPPDGWLRERNRQQEKVRIEFHLF